MKLRGIEYGAILGASGVQGFRGEGYWFHPLLKPFGLDFTGMTFVAKTTTLDPRKGNMPLTRRFTPKEWKPGCIWVDRNLVLNAVGLSGPGAEALFGLGSWQNRKDAFFLSFMPQGSSSDPAEARRERLEEMRGFVQLFLRHRRDFLGSPALQINVSCPNTGHKTEELLAEVEELLDIAASLDIPLMPKFNLLVKPREAARISEHPACDGICAANTIPFGAMPERVDWECLFPGGSPLQEFGGGGLSGPMLFPLLHEWVQEARSAGLKKPINAGGGISSPEDIDTLLEAGLQPGFDSVFIGSAAILYPLRVRDIIKHANKVLAAPVRSKARCGGTPFAVPY